MPAACKVGSVDSGHDGFSSGVIVTGQALLTVNGSPLSGTGDMSVIHKKPKTPPHVGIVIGSSKLTVNGIPIATLGDITGCGAAIVSGEPLFTID